MFLPAKYAGLLWLGGPNADSQPTAQLPFAHGVALTESINVTASILPSK